MERTHKVGQQVVFVDQYGKKHDALITIWWGQDDQGNRLPGNPEGELGCNVVYVCDDVEKRDSCGRQIERSTSVVHKSKQIAHGMYWCWPDEA
jgi:hypothetical protein